MKEQWVEGRQIETYKGIGVKKRNLFHKMGITTDMDLLYLLPCDYKDMRSPLNIEDLNTDTDKGVLVKGRVLISYHNKSYRSKVSRMTIGDNTGKMDIVFFNWPFVDNILRKNTVHYFYGKIKKTPKGIEMVQPQILSVEDYKKEIIPVYPTIKGISQKDVIKINKQALSNDIKEILPREILDENKLFSLKEALEKIHFPKNRQEYLEGKRRLTYQELFFLEKAFSNMDNSKIKGIVIKEKPTEYLDALDFKLTESQNKALMEILLDMSSGVRMNRLLQGDVGSGKTAVAAAALFACALSGYQGAMIAPTEILAKQHYNTLKPVFEHFGIAVSLLVGAMKAKEKRLVLEDIASGKTQLVLGTHALIEDSVIFNNLALVITDEQHRFGVNQRFKLSKKGINPHILVMTATPIPRTLGVIFYGDLDMSIIDSLPEGRKETLSYRLSSKNRASLYKELVKEVKVGRQGYIVAPLISETENLEDVASVESLKIQLDKLFKKEGIVTAVLHSAMSSEEKDRIMSDFIERKIDIIIGTVVIEVGINVPNATFMVIENAERFGLAQLHQLRGRVGRGKYQSSCYFISDAKGEIAKNRLKTIVESRDGFYIAEKDLEMRGPGEIFGIKQHGSLDEKLKLAIRHIDILRKVKEDIKTYKEEIDRFDFSHSSRYTEMFNHISL